jgi:DNA-binding transcriptional regulator YdaS (Cro superfamily)
MSTAALKRACEVAGGQKPLADRIGTTQSQVWYWLTRSKKGVPAEFVLSIERETGVSRSEMRPDLWPASVGEREILSTGNAS